MGRTCLIRSPHSCDAPPPFDPCAHGTHLPDFLASFMPPALTQHRATQTIASRPARLSSTAHARLLRSVSPPYSKARDHEDDLAATPPPPRLCWTPAVPAPLPRKNHSQQQHALPRSLPL